jgi:hypothetical protein
MVTTLPPAFDVCEHCGLKRERAPQLQDKCDSRYRLAERVEIVSSRRDQAQSALTRDLDI